MLASARFGPSFSKRKRLTRVPSRPKSLMRAISCARLAASRTANPEWHRARVDRVVATSLGSRSVAGILDSDARPRICHRLALRRSVSRASVQSARPFDRSLRERQRLRERARLHRRTLRASRSVIRVRPARGLRGRCRGVQRLGANRVQQGANLRRPRVDPGKLRRSERLSARSRAPLPRRPHGAGLDRQRSASSPMCRRALATEM